MNNLILLNESLIDMQSHLQITCFQGIYCKNQRIIT